MNIPRYRNIFSKKNTVNNKKKYIGIILCILNAVNNTNQARKRKLIFFAVEKAFDNLEWTFIFMTLKNHYRQNFLTWMQTVYKEQEDKTMKNSFVLQRSTIMKGKIQGCAFSPFLYIYWH